MANRTQQRAAASNRQTVKLPPHHIVVDRRQIEPLVAAQRFFLAIVRAQGRVRVTDEELSSLKEGDTVTMRRDGTVIALSFKASDLGENEG